MTKKAKTDRRIKAFKIVFKAFDKECIEYFRQTDNEEHIRRELKHLCETYYIIKRTKVLLPKKKENLLWDIKKKTLNKPPTDQELEKVDKDIKAGTKK